MNMVTDPDGFDVVLQMAEAATNTQTGLDETGDVPDGMEDTEERAELMLHPDDVTKIVMSAEESDLCFHKPDDHLGEDRVMLGEHPGLDPNQEPAIMEPKNKIRFTGSNDYQLSRYDLPGCRSL
jgi:hypothetical protein